MAAPLQWGEQMSDSAERKRILLLDESASDRLLAFQLLSASSALYDVIQVADPQEFSSHLERADFDLLVAERSLSWLPAGRLLQRVKARCPECLVIFFTRPDLYRSSIQDLEGGAFATVMKDSDGFLMLPQIVERALKAVTAPDQEEKGGGLERFPVGAIGLNPNGSLRYANQAALDILGINADVDLDAVLLIDYLATSHAKARVRDMLDNGGEVDVETRLQRPDGMHLWVRLRLTESDDTEGILKGALEDISEYKHTEAELARQAADLGRSNMELEQFAYVVSHDLQEPLSLIQRYAKLLAEGSALNDSTDSDHVKQVLRSSRRMQSMMDAILEFSRIETKGRPFEMVDFNAVLDETCAHLTDMIETSDADIKYADLPTLQADHGQMLQLFQNLLSNAIKFQSQDQKPRILIEAEQRGQYWAFTVKDNGIGIPDESRERVFAMFQRLHTGDEYPGTGIGLAICRSIVKRHGGEIHLETGQNGGTEVHFTISRWL